ncbi:MAG: alpha/beta hydrolase [Bacteroidales bacterium]|nr:alpha/beta hydrolase [Bacteroidales bacterium]
MKSIKILFTLLSFAFLIVYFSCNPVGRKKDNENNIIDTTITLKTIYQRGIINTITALKNPLCSYSFYIPKDSLPNYPVLLLLDPHAKGTFTVSLYQQLAEKYDIILISSNNIRNQMSLIEIDSYISQIITDAKEFLAIDTNRLYLGGFSGTARAIYQIASNSNKYKGIVAIGAGLNQPFPWKDSTFCLIQMAGFKDMNFQEVYESHLIQRNISTLYMAFLYEDIHQWPIDTIMEFAWINFFGKNKTEQAKSFILKFYQYAQQIPMRDSWKKTLLFGGLRSMCYNIKYYQFPFNEINNYLNKFESKNALKQLQNILKTEQKEKEELAANFLNKDSVWWAKTIKYYCEVDQKKQLSPSDYKDIRIKYYLGLLSYSYTRNALQQNRMDLARNFLQIYRQLEPFNPDMMYFWSVFLVKQKQYSRAIDSLSKAIKLGFSDKLLLQNENSFINIKDSLRFLNIISRIK